MRNYLISFLVIFQMTAHLQAADDDSPSDYSPIAFAFSNLRNFIFGDSMQKAVARGHIKTNPECNKIYKWIQEFDTDEKQIFAIGLQGPGKLGEYLTAYQITVKQLSFMLKYGDMDYDDMKVLVNQDYFDRTFMADYKAFAKEPLCRCLTHTTHKLADGTQQKYSVYHWSIEQRIKMLRGILKRGFPAEDIHMKKSSIHKTKPFKELKKEYLPYSHAPVDVKFHRSPCFKGHVWGDVFADPEVVEVIMEKHVGVYDSDEEDGNDDTRAEAFDEPRRTKPSKGPSTRVFRSSAAVAPITYQ